MKFPQDHHMIMSTWRGSEIAISLFAEFGLRFHGRQKKLQKSKNLLVSSVNRVWTRTGHFWRLPFELLAKIVRITAIGNPSDTHT